jgi:hypothetical protein
VEYEVESTFAQEMASFFDLISTEITTIRTRKKKRIQTRKKLLSPSPRQSQLRTPISLPTTTMRKKRRTTTKKKRRKKRWKQKSASLLEVVHPRSGQRRAPSLMKKRKPRKTMMTMTKMKRTELTRILTMWLRNTTQKKIFAESKWTRKPKN